MGAATARLMAAEGTADGAQLVEPPALAEGDTPSSPRRLCISSSTRNTLDSMPSRRARTLARWAASVVEELLALVMQSKRQECDTANEKDDRGLFFTGALVRTFSSLRKSAAAGYT